MSNSSCSVVKRADELRNLILSLDPEVKEMVVNQDVPVKEVVLVVEAS